MKRFYSKKEFILSKCKDKNVLDLGCIEHDLFREKMKKEDSPMSKDPVSKLPTYQVAAGLIRKNEKGLSCFCLCFAC